MTQYDHIMNDDYNSLATNFIAEVQKWNICKFSEIKLKYVCDGLDTKEISSLTKLNKTQKDVDVAKTVGASECVAASALGVIGGALLFTPAAPIGVILGLTGLGLGVKGAVVENGATFANFVIGKKTLREFEKDLMKAEVDLKKFVEILKKVDALADDVIKEGKDETDMSDDKGDVILKILESLATFWMKQKLEDEKLNFECLSEDLKAIQSISNKDILREIWSGVKGCGEAVSLGKAFGDVVVVSSNISKKGIGVLTDVASVGASSGLVSTLDDISGSAGSLTARFGTTSSKVISGLGIVGGMAGIAFSSYSIHQYRKSMDEGSKSKKGKLIAGHIKNVETAIRIRLLVEEKLQLALVAADERVTLESDY